MRRAQTYVACPKRALKNAIFLEVWNQGKIGLDAVRENSHSTFWANNWFSD